MEDSGAPLAISSRRSTRRNSGGLLDAQPNSQRSDRTGSFIPMGLPVRLHRIPRSAAHAIPESPAGVRFRFSPPGDPSAAASSAVVRYRYRRLSSAEESGTNQPYPRMWDPPHTAGDREAARAE